MIQSAISQSINRIDTASMYGFGRAESLVGKTISHNRPQIILSTKFGLALEQQELYASTVERHAVILHWNVAPSSIGFIKACAEGRRRNFYNVRLAVWFGSVQHCTCTRLKQNDVGQAFWNRTIEDIDTISAAPLSCALITTVPLSLMELEDRSSHYGQWKIILHLGIAKWARVLLSTYHVGVSFKAQTFHQKGLLAAKILFPVSSTERRLFNIIAAEPAQSLLTYNRPSRPSCWGRLQSKTYYS